MSPSLRFEVEATDGSARTGRLATSHGIVETPAFMTVATYGAVRGLGPEDLEALGAQILLANTYHLHERPGEDVVREAGGLHGFTGWSGPWLTDSGGFQVASLADRVRIEETGVSFTSPLDGCRRLLTPESVVRIQEALGSDVAMVLDECPPPSDAPDAELRIRAAAERTLRWALRARRAASREDQALFGIVQGGASKTLRRHCAASVAEIGFDGYAHGGLGLGESGAARRELVECAHEFLPSQAPRYLMGLGRPEDLVDAIEAGVDLFDCVLPTRHARHGVLFTAEGLLRIRNARFARDDAPIEPGCDCPTCGRHGRGYLRHLLRTGEMLGARLATLHNVRFYLRLLEDARRAISAGTFAALAARVRGVAGRRLG